MTKPREIDQVTGIETTGHEWDGLKELNKPLPRWWLYTFYVTILWSIGYWVVYPAWPTLTGYTPGIWGYSQRATVTAEVKAAREAQKGLRDKLDKTPLADVAKDADLLRFARAGGAAAFQTNCGPCHGRGGAGFVGYPNLLDDDWIWGGTIDEIYKTIQFGIRSDHKSARATAMPKFGVDGVLKPEQIADLTEFVLSLAKSSHDQAAAARAAPLFKEQCATCHGEDGKGKLDQGAVNLTDPIWLYGGTREAIRESINTGRGGVMPAWTGRLDPVTIKALAVYVNTRLGDSK